ncbi:MAG: fructosamine kinase family protein [Gallionella sp.]|nr:fructosamine kinase family protein [Gallionella sp.]
MTDWPAISAAIGPATRQPFQIISHEATGGGCINQTWRIRGQDGRQFFVKLNDMHHHNMFAAEATGLSEIAATQTIRVPCPIVHGSVNSHSFLVLEYLELNNHGNAALLGEQLAALHRCTPDQTKAGANNQLATICPLPCRERAGERVDCEPPPFGFEQDNFIGTTPQPNGWKDSWIDFWREQRLGFQLQLAEQNGYGGRLQALGEKLIDALPAFFVGYTPQPSLLHGDLWGGNHAFLMDGTPLIFDPAPYYGDRECDLAMTELFGGYPADFYAAYRAAYPLDSGYATRRDLYNLYHILNHANLFGGGYARQAEQMIQRFLVEAG